MRLAGNSDFRKNVYKREIFKSRRGARENSGEGVHKTNNAKTGVSIIIVYTSNSEQVAHYK